jgi:N utilization substance protein A
MVQANDDEHTARVVVMDDMLSLAIGKDGQNARLAAKLTGWKIDVKPYSSLVQNGEEVEETVEEVPVKSEETFAEDIFAEDLDDIE